MKKMLAALVAIAAVLMLVVMVRGTGTGEVAVASPSASASATAGANAAATAQPSEAVPGPDLDRILAQLANKANSTLPMMLDRNTRWDTTMAGPGKNFTYFYTIPGRASADLDPVVTREAIAPQVTGNVCGNRDMQVMFKAGVTAHYVYRGNDGVEVVRLAIAPADCGVTPEPWFNPEALTAPG